MNSFRFKYESDGDGSQPHGSHPDAPNSTQQQHQQFLGDASGALPNFGDIDTVAQPLPEGVTVAHVKSFEKMYREHAEVNTFEFEFLREKTYIV